MPYVVTEPKSGQRHQRQLGGVPGAISGVSGVRYQKVGSREEAEALLAGVGVLLAPGLTRSPTATTLEASEFG